MKCYKSSVQYTRMSAGTFTAAIILITLTLLLIATDVIQMMKEPARLAQLKVCSGSTWQLCALCASEA